MRKDFRLNFSVFIFSMICLESGNAEFVFSEEIIRRPENSFDDALSLLQKLMVDFRSSLTYVANCSKWFSCWCRQKLSTTRIPSTTYFRSVWSNGAAVSFFFRGVLVIWRTLKNNCYIGILNLQQLVYQAILKVFFRASIFRRIRFLKKLKMRTMWGKERYGTIFFMSVLFSNPFWVQTDVVELHTILLESQEQEGRSW